MKEFSIITGEEFERRKEDFSHCDELLHSLGSIRYCKSEVYRDCMIGTLRIPRKSEQRENPICLGFYITEDTLLFIEETGDLRRWLKNRLDKIGRLQTADQILLQLMELMVENDILYLTHFEKEIERLEESLLHHMQKDFFEVLTGYRKKLLELNAYYQQLIAIGDVIQSHEGLSLVESVEPWGRYSLRIERLQNHVHVLRENILQLRELFQSRQDAQQNKIMCILTVVTTLFLPLTLLTGWYGMNFSFMPELHWRYGYLAVMVAAVLIVSLEIVYIKRKKFF